ncbi:beta-ketoacyl synthase N-terminal-like domain-containing protein [Nonomuraea purpurea]|uniref:Beta-ketoacyl synthase N-terminal-like domain-containing protein n=1 Tax=Nonomuraea purpurea TaxID=1849276 RepID=A0ABV8GPM6_9ACTN
MKPTPTMSGTIARAATAAVTAYAVHVPGADGERALPGALRVPACSAEQAHELLGRKGLLAKDEATRLALCAVHRALGRPPRAPRPDHPADPATAVVVASNLGNTATVARIAAEARERGARSVSPLDAPTASSNVIAGAVAIWFRYGGPNLTVCSGATAGMDAIWLGCLLLRSGRAEQVVVVGVEPGDPVAAALHASRAGAVPGISLRAAAACLVLRSAPAAPGAQAVLELSADPVDVGDGAPVKELGDTYGAAGVLRTALAVAELEPGGRTRVICGDRVDGGRELWVGRA